MQVEEAALHVPELGLLASELEKGLKGCFADVWVKVAPCPDLTQAPYKLASQGLGGHPVLVDVGGVMNLQYVANRTKAHFDLGEIANRIGRPNAALMGPGAGWVDAVPEHTNSELIASVSLATKQINSRYAVVKKDGSPHLAPYPHLDFGILGNFLASDGQPGQVLEIYAAKRTGADNFVTSMRKTLAASPAFSGTTLALGGAFQIEKGKIKAHIMPDFHPCDEFHDPSWHVYAFLPSSWIVWSLQGPQIAFRAFWLIYYEFHAPLTCVSVFATGDPGLDLRLEHTHFYSEHGQGGHYHYDVMPDDVVYHGYYVPCERAYRVARHQKPPAELHVPRPAAT